MAESVIHNRPHPGYDLLRQMFMRKTAWIWLVGCCAWTLDAAVSLSVHSAAHAELAIVLAMLFGIAWLFYRSQPR
jgi:hypothetical protein